jgi:hypothetical protein
MRMLTFIRTTRPRKSRVFTRHDGTACARCVLFAISSPGARDIPLPPIAIDRNILLLKWEFWQNEAKFSHVSKTSAVSKVLLSRLFGS